MGSLVVQDVDKTSGIDSVAEVPRTRIEPQTNFPRRRSRLASNPDLHDENFIRPLNLLSPDITSTRLPSNLFALIIGINNYKSPSIQNLEGAVPDADAMQDYLQNYLGVPSSQIRNLRNSEATRAAIIDGIQAFSVNNEIKKGDPILIYYAGYGASAKTPEDWLDWNARKVELLVPYDHSSLDSNPIHGIPDRTLGVLLSKLAIEKGDNIVRQTFILPEFIYQLTT